MTSRSSNWFKTTVSPPKNSYYITYSGHPGNSNLPKNWWTLLKAQLIVLLWFIECIFSSELWKHSTIYSHDISLRPKGASVIFPDVKSGRTKRLCNLLNAINLAVKKMKIEVFRSLPQYLSPLKMAASHQVYVRSTSLSNKLCVFVITVIIIRAAPLLSACHGLSSSCPLLSARDPQKLRLCSWLTQGHIARG